MAKKMKNAPRIKIPVDRQTPDTTFGGRVPPPVTRLPPPPPKQPPEVDPNAETKA